MPRLGPPQSASIVGRPEAVEQAGTDTHACSDDFTRYGGRGVAERVWRGLRPSPIGYSGIEPRGFWTDGRRDLGDAPSSPSAL